MSAIGKEKFCSACSKNVIDFSTLSDRQIINLLENNNSRVCGRFYKEQLNRLITPTDTPANPSLSTVLAALLVVASAGTVSAQTAGLCSDSLQLKSEASLSYSNKKVQPGVIYPGSKIEGKIMDETTKEPLQGATVYISSTGFFATTDKEGKFAINIPASDKTKKTVSVEVAYIGYNPRKLIVPNKELSVSQNIGMKALTPEEFLMGEVVIAFPTKRRAIKKSN
jgi:hypothetical protein